jgi:sugar-specific transcriptional regulator TrmB
MNIEKFIERLGYKRKEAQLYLAALVLGESRIADLAAKLKVPRTSAIMLAEKLHKDGLMNYYNKRSHRYWVAESPDKLLNKLKSEEETLISMLPALKLMQKNCDTKPTVKTYTGSKEIYILLEDIIITKNNFLSIVAWNDFLATFGNGYIEDFLERQAKHFLHMRLICHKKESTLHLKEDDHKQLRETRFFSEQTPLNSATFIYGNKVAIISLNPTFPTGFLIEDADVARTMTIFFEQIWKNTLSS